jgi:hypothetical protein
MSVSSESHPSPQRTVDFYGHVLDFTPEVRHLVIDHAATVAFGIYPQSRERLGSRPDPRSDLDRHIDSVLDRLADRATPDEIYAYMVAPNPALDDECPVGLLAANGLARVIEQLGSDFPSSPNGRA